MEFIYVRDDDVDVHHHLNSPEAHPRPYISCTVNPCSIQQHEYLKLDSFTCLFLQEQQLLCCLEYFVHQLSRVLGMCLHLAAVTEEVWMMWLSSDPRGNGKDTGQLSCAVN